MGLRVFAVVQLHTPRPILIFIDMQAGRKLHGSGQGRHSLLSNYPTARGNDVENGAWNPKLKPQLTDTETATINPKTCNTQTRPHEIMQYLDSKMHERAATSCTCKQLLITTYWQPTPHAAFLRNNCTGTGLGSDSERCLEIRSGGSGCDGTAHQASMLASDGFSLGRGKLLWCSFE